MNSVANDRARPLTEAFRHVFSRCSREGDQAAGIRKLDEAAQAPSP